MSITNEYHSTYAGHHYFIGHAKKYPLLPYALDGLGLYRKQGYINRPDGIESYQWTQCVSGTGEFFYNNKVFTITPGMAIYVPAHFEHQYHNISSDFCVNYLYFGGALMTELMAHFHMLKPAVYVLNHPERVLEYEDQMMALHLSNGENTAYEISKILYCCIFDIVHDINKVLPNAGSKENILVHQAIRFMQAHYAQPIGLQEIAENLTISKEHLCRIFRKNTKTTISAYLEEIRICEAKNMILKYPGKTIGEICHLCGFDSPSYFSVIFKKREHMTPLEFRHDHKRLSLDSIIMDDI